VKLYLLIILGQEAQMSQRDRAMLRVTEYFTKSLEIGRACVRGRAGVSLY